MTIILPHRKHTITLLLAAAPVAAAIAFAPLSATAQNASPATAARTAAARTAATAAIPPEVADQPVSLRYYTLSLGAAITDISAPGTAGTRSARMTIPNGSLSNVMQYRGPRLMSFYEASSAPATAQAGGQQSASAAAGITADSAAATQATGAQAAVAPAPPLAQVLLPTGVESVLLLFIPGENGGPVQVAAMPLNEQQFTSGSLLFQNFTPEPIAVNIGKQTLALQPMLSSVYQHKGGNTREEGMIRMAKLNKDGNPSLFYQSRWTLLPQRRTWVFFLPGKEEGDVNIRRFYDIPSVSGT